MRLLVVACVRAGRGRAGSGAGRGGSCAPARARATTSASIASICERRAHLDAQARLVPGPALAKEWTTPGATSTDVARTGEGESGGRPGSASRPAATSKCSAWIGWTCGTGTAPPGRRAKSNASDSPPVLAAVSVKVNRSPVTGFSSVCPRVSIPPRLRSPRRARVLAEVARLATEGPWTPSASLALRPSRTSVKSRSKTYTTSPGTPASAMLRGERLEPHRHEADRRVRRRGDLRVAVANVSSARTGQLVDPPACPSSVSAATATSAMSSTSMNGSGTSPRGARPRRALTARGGPSLKFCANQRRARSSIRRRPPGQRRSPAGPPPRRGRTAARGAAHRARPPVGERAHRLGRARQPRDRGRRRRRPRRALQRGRHVPRSSQSKRLAGARAHADGRPRDAQPLGHSAAGLAGAAEHQGWSLCVVWSHCSWVPIPSPI